MQQLHTEFIFPALEAICGEKQGIKDPEHPAHNHKHQEGGKTKKTGPSATRCDYDPGFMLGSLHPQLQCDHISGCIPRASTCCLGGTTVWVLYQGVSPRYSTLPFGSAFEQSSLCRLQPPPGTGGGTNLWAEERRYSTSIENWGAPHPSPASTGPWGDDVLNSILS